jgi:hypothetical protein
MLNLKISTWILYGRTFYLNATVLGYGWKRLDFDIFLEDRQSGLPPLQRFLHCSAEGSHPKRFSWTPCNHSTNLVVLSGSSLNQISQQIKLSLSLVLGLDVQRSSRRG